MGTGHNLTPKDKALEREIFKVSMVLNQLYLLSPSIKCKSIFKGREDREIKRKHQVNILSPF